MYYNSTLGYLLYVFDNDYAIICSRGDNYDGFIRILYKD